MRRTSGFPVFRYVSRRIAGGEAPAGFYKTKTAGTCRKTRGIDVKAVKRERSPDDVRRLNGCEMELARGASHIASMLYEHSIHAAVRETLVQFEASHGRDDLKGFADALLSKLEQRGKQEAVKVLHGFLKHGRLPEQTAGAQPGPVSTRKSIAQKRRVTQLPKGKARVGAEAT